MKRVCQHIPSACTLSALTRASCDFVRAFSNQPNRGGTASNRTIQPCWPNPGPGKPHRHTHLEAVSCFRSFSSQFKPSFPGMRRLVLKTHSDSDLMLRHMAVKTLSPLFLTARTYSTTMSATEASYDALKSVSGLQVKRPIRKKLPILYDDNKTDSVVAYAVAEDIDLNSLEKHLKSQSLYNIGKLPPDVMGALHIRGKYNIDQKPKEIFVFGDGAVIFWCVPDAERSTFLKHLYKFSQGQFSSALVLYEREELNFVYTSESTKLVDDTIELKDSDRDSQGRILEMYAFSNALAQSVKLAIWEASFNSLVSSIENVTEDLRHGRKISMTRRQVLMKTGELFNLRHDINLSSNLLDTPDFYWDREALEPLYRSLCNYLSISRRTKVMNQKLNHCCELTDLLTSQLNNTHHVRLEVMIIVLIMVEVLFEIVHSAEKYWNKPAEASDQRHELPKIPAKH